MAGSATASTSEERKVEGKKGGKKHRVHDEHKQEENINIRAAVVHVIGDML